MTGHTSSLLPVESSNFTLSRHLSIPARIAALPNNGPISPVAQNAAMVLIVCLLIVTAFRRVLEVWIFPRMFRDRYPKMDERSRRSFVNSSMHLLVRLAVLPVATPPLIMILAGRRNYNSGFTKTVDVSFGTIELVAMELVISVYLHEIIYRPGISLVALLHHVGAIAIGSYAILHTLEWESQKSTTMYFTMACLWGLFDIMCETGVYLVLVVRALTENPTTRYRTCRFAFWVQILGMLVETPFVTWIFWAEPMRIKWDSIACLISTPIVHAVFLTAQIVCANSFWGMSRKYQKESEDGQAAVMLENGNLEGKSPRGGKATVVELSKQTARKSCSWFQNLRQPRPIDNSCV
jgi:hypothetical protein